MVCFATINGVWYLDRIFLKETTDFHEIAILPDAGIHTVSVIDALGNETSIIITID